MKCHTCKHWDNSQPPYDRCLVENGIRHAACPGHTTCTYEPVGVQATFENPEPQELLTIEALTLDHFRAWRWGQTPPLNIRGHGFTLTLTDSAYLPDLSDTLAMVLCRLMSLELRLFEE